jgi:hypothetical protein
MHSLENPVNAVRPGQLKALLRDLSSPKANVSIRLEVKGGTLTDRFATVLVYEEHALLLTHLPTRTVINVPHIDDVTGFVIDKPHLSFLPFRHYVVNKGWSQM